MDNTLLESSSAMAKNSTFRRKEEETSHIDLLVIVAWILMIIREMQRSIQSEFTELNNEISKESLKNITFSIKLKALPSKACIVKLNTLQDDDVNLGLCEWNIRATEKQTGHKSILHEELSKSIEWHNHFRPKPTRIFAYPTSIRTYVEDVIRTPQQGDLMRHEWARYQTYRSFPKTSKVQPIILSRAGFYYTGNQDETTCFSCMLKYKNWQSEDKPWEKHRQMSPDCAFLNGSDGRNVAIERNEQDRGQQEKVVESLHEEHGASGDANESFPSAHNEYASLENHTARTMRNSREADTNEQHERISSNVERSIGPSSTRISSDRAKHPYYATLFNRLSSFTGWLGLTTHQPRDMASAGFFYVGTDDCVRCFFCGGGLRRWRNGDDPYAEHARWYPDCDYIRIYRGDEDLQVFPRDTEGSPETNDAPSVRNAPDISQTELEQASLKTTAVQSILSMGYSIQQVTHAMETFTTHQGHGDFTVEQLLEIVLDEEELQCHDSDANPSGNQHVSDSFQRQVDVSSSSCVNCASNTTAPSNVGLERQNSSDGSASSNDVESILEENRELKEQMTCKICMDAEACIVFLPCSHMMSCPQCAPAFRKCPICRALVRGTVRAFKS
ncbi:hypothetical protein ACJMK2_028992 [Sinanodonta woodiana]|uniref:RING-type domain-containing protein n=1 Tax=Sinanodonta woodiana TaxID=1069815 RepID=A0ABD3XAB0_SINWO